MKKVLTGVVLSGLIATSAYAGCSGRYCTDVTVSKLTILASGTVYIDTSGSESALTCTPISGKYIVLTGSEKNTMYSTLLTAYTTKKNISLATIDNGADECTAQYVSIN